jgi:hypothetical protein
MEPVLFLFWITANRAESWNWLPAGGMALLTCCPIAGFDAPGAVFVWPTEFLLGEFPI